MQEDEGRVGVFFFGHLYNNVSIGSSLTMLLILLNNFAYVDLPLLLSLSSLPRYFELKYCSKADAQLKS